MMTFEVLKVNGKVYVEINDGEYTFVLEVADAVALGNLLKASARGKDCVD